MVKGEADVLAVQSWGPWVQAPPAQSQRAPGVAESGDAEETEPLPEADPSRRRARGEMPRLVTRLTARRDVPAPESPPARQRDVEEDAPGRLPLPLWF